MWDGDRFNTTNKKKKNRVRPKYRNCFAKLENQRKSNNKEVREQNRVRTSILYYKDEKKTICRAVELVAPINMRPSSPFQGVPMPHTNLRRHGLQYSKILLIIIFTVF